eukprot:CAMPEP_0206222904 /NCGR_PEP_ID=MMETSP0047_2-20121206/6206_1 /ASSEMBLY_ACC=CAM_ASM_000192 /TAXON_ID=195065 /ORGANISM="Chroomonas mesostigmatica_cf, Strain CCMP1168" /LENGTH=48 /DNA_ID= /DNA_START= /DNA_END= /DNA_ORIENTATION=
MALARPSARRWARPAPAERPALVLPPPGAAHGEVADAPREGGLRQQPQ